MDTTNIINESFDTTQKYTSGFDYTDENAAPIDISQLDLEIDIAHIDQYENEEYALLRREGLGTSDSSIVLGVNPYTTKAELITQKCTDYLTEEEKAVGDKSAVRKGSQLEPLIIHKHQQLLNKRIIKPIHMYRHKDYPYIKFNFDGVIDKHVREDGTYQYIPDEIKVVTMYGQKHYNRAKAYYRESIGIQGLPENYANDPVDITNKAARYGIPPYYYTQLQQQILGLNAPYGYLTVLFETTWEVCSFFIWRDQKVINQLIIEDTKTWNIIEQKRPADFDIGVEIKDTGEETK